MPYATNPIDGVRTYFEDSGGRGSPVLVYPGFTDPLEYAKTSPLAQPLDEDFRLVFAARFLSLLLCGNQPYDWPVDGPMMRAVSDAVAAGRERGMVAFVETWEASIGETFPEPARTWMLENDPLALDAEFRSALVEGPISRDLGSWNIPCLISAGEHDEMHENAARGAAEIPGATFVSLRGHTHFSAELVTDQLLPHVLALFRSAAPRSR